MNGKQAAAYDRLRKRQPFPGIGARSWVIKEGRSVGFTATFNLSLMSLDPCPAGTHDVRS